MSTLYNQDYAKWAEVMAEQLEQKNFQGLDLENLVGEIRDLSKRERDRLISSLRLILQQLLKWDHQSQKRSRSWQVTIDRERTNISLYLEDSPSLKQYLCEEWLQKAYRIARLDAANETGLTFPEDCPYSIAVVLHCSVILE